jgi:hypothetical protein
LTFTIRSKNADTATVTVNGYSLDLSGHCLDELSEACRSLLTALAHGTTADTDSDLRRQLPGVAPAALLHAWMFPCFMVWMPVLVFATEGPLTAIYTRTLSERHGMPLVVRDGRDRDEPTIVATADVIREAQDFLAMIRD